jgi:ABC-type sugar transport system ATPase subunit
LALSLFGASRQTSGELLLHGKAVHLRSPHDTRRERVALIPEDRKSQGLMLGDSVEDNIALAHIEKTETPLHLLSRAKKRLMAEEMAGRLSVQPPDVRMAAGNLSGGNQQKVVLGKWLTGDPEIILMDEPTRGIDIGAKAEIYRLITEMAESGKGVVIFSSELDELRAICDRILVLCRGAIVGEAAADNITTEQLLTMALGAESHG